MPEKTDDIVAATESVSTVTEQLKEPSGPKDALADEKQTALELYQS